MVLMPASTSCLALAGPIPDTRIRRLIAVLVSSSRILKKSNKLLSIDTKKTHFHGKKTLQ
jgi:hypothetical protein